MLAVLCSLNALNEKLNDSIAKNSKPLQEVISTPCTPDGGSLYGISSSAIPVSPTVSSN